ncbi:1-acyl-sn-glycerol-3-phosphate acyltransferase [candidate division KSB1 bacterium]
MIKILFGINILGKENIRGLNRYIIISNHNSHIDILLLFYLLPVKHIRTTHPVAAEEYFSRSKILLMLVNYLFAPVWVTRSDAESRKESFSRIREKLDHGHNIIIFPEGTRGEPGQILPFKTGIGRLAEEYRTIPIVPVFLSGPERAMPKKSFFPVPLWNDIVVGPPQLFQSSFSEFTQTLETLIRDLSMSVALRHKRKIKTEKAVKTVAVLGIDGSGKSTVSQNVAKQLSCFSGTALVSDKLEFYEDCQLRQVQPFITEKIRSMIGIYAKNARSLKHYKIPKLTELFLRDILLAEIKRWYYPGSIVLDGAPLLNLTAWAVLYKGDYFNRDVCEKIIGVLSSRDEDVPKDDPVYAAFPELAAIKRLRLNHLTLPDIVMFLDVEPELAMERILKRGSKQQVHETPEKLTKLRSAYEMVCGVISEKFNVPVITLNGSESLDNVTSAAVDFVKKNLKISVHSGSE